jgi:hypothetical protein
VLRQDALYGLRHSAGGAAPVLLHDQGEQPPHQAVLGGEVVEDAAGVHPQRITGVGGQQVDRRMRTHDATSV